MDKSAAQKLVQETLQGSFNKERFVYLVKNILNRIEEAPFTYKGKFIFDDFANSIRLVERVGKYQSPDEKLVDILIVHLTKDTSLDRARTKQRNFVAKYLKGSRGGVLKDAALVAFVAPNGEDWRFSLVKMEYKFKETPSGRVKVEEEFTPARRYSFLVGKNENSHTAQSRLLPLLLDDETPPTLQDLEETFSVERVTKEFFEKYRDLFLRLKESLDAVVKKDAKVKADFEKKNVDTADFAKKLLGQIVFLYFLQKKGWFGVKRGEAWGSGSKHFLRELFEKKHGDYKNFFNDILEPLFYEALRLERPGDYYSRFNCRIPFLNGGLFDPVNDYDWWNTDILLPDDIFSNDRKTKEGDTGDGILDIFDRYNFTVKEDEPLEKEVAVDPEMLGKVFENLLEVKDRKSKGTYYTPREIVHYMCQESLANYLATELEEKVSKEDMETLIKYGETVVEHDSRVVNQGRETTRYSFKLPESVRKHAKLIDEKLAAIRVCDPAVGSGAFPVGMMNEIIRTRNALTAYIGENGERTPYHFKRHAIQNCLYGVDIDPGAVEIAKLRLWLSLVVDEEEREQIQPLPNLDYKIMQGNSLVELITDNITADNERNKLVKQMKQLKDKLFNTTSPQAKQKIKNEIDQLIKRLFEYDRAKEIERLRQKIQAIQSQGRLFEDKKAQKEDEKKIKELEKKIKEIKQIKVPGPAEHFEWHINFSEVFAEKGGFDVVIANPPYGFRNVLTAEEKRYFRKEKGIPFPSGDIAELFIVITYKNLIRERGTQTFIIPKKSLYGESWLNVRKLWTSAKLLYLMDASKAFEKVLLEQVSYSLARDNSPQLIQIGALDQNNDRIEVFGKFRLEDIFTENLRNAQIYRGLYPQELLQKIDSISITDTSSLVRGKIGISNITADLTFEKDSNYPCVKGIDITRYGLKRERYLKVSKAKKYIPLYQNDKIVAQKIIAHVQNPYPHIIITLFYDDKKRLIHDTCVEIENLEAGLSKKFLLAYFQSAFCNWYAYNLIYNRAIRTMDFINYYITQIPIPKEIVKDKNKQKPFIDLVDKILAITKDDDYLENPAKQARVREYEKQIDQLIYQLYGLTDDEIKIVEEKSYKLYLPAPRASRQAGGLINEEIKIVEKKNE